MDGVVAYILSKSYTKKSLIGIGALAGAPCQVQSINKVGKTTTITLKWEDNVGGVHTQAFDIEDGLDGVSVSNATIKSNGHLELTLSNGTTIDCGKVLPQYDAMPTPSSSNEGQILQYIGTTTSNYTNGYFYECINDGSTYKWVEKLVQDSYTKIQIGDLSNLPDNTKNVVENIVDINNKIDDKENIFRYNVIPTADVSINGAIIQYIGTTNATYTNGYYYQCVESPVGSGTYVWVQKNVQPNNGGGGGDGVVDGYYNSADQLFYEDSAFLNPITGEDNTIYVDLNTNGLYRYDGTIFIKVSSSAESIQVTTLPTADVTQLDKIYQYIGVTDTNYTNGYFYKCILDGANYKWQVIPTQDSYTKAEIGALSDLPNPSKNVVENIELLHGSMATLQGSMVDIKNDITVLDGSVVNIKNDITNLQGSLADINKDKLDRLEPIYLVGSGLNLDSDPTSPTYGKLTATGMSIPIDDHLDASSINPVQNRVITLNIEQLQGSVLEKIQKKLAATADDFVVFTNDGDIADSGISKDVIPSTVSVSNKLLVASDLSAKADKVSGATDNDIALLDNTGNLKDSNKKLSDYQEKLTDGNGVVIDSSNNIGLDLTYLTASRVGYIPATEKGANSGVAELNSSGKVPSSQLPSYVDDVIEGYYNENDGKFYKESTYTTEIVGEDGKIYISIDTNIQYRWTGSAFAALGGALQLGETSSTAYRGDRGKTAYDHSQITNGSNPHNTTADNVNLKVPIPALSGSKLDVESTLYGVNTELGKKADKVASATNGHLAGLDANGNLTDSGVVADDVIQKVTTATGLLKDDGTVDTTEYQPKTLAVPIQTLSGSQLTVETALSGINDDVVKTFTGTQAQWDALSLADKQKYEICNITDDGSTDNVYTVGEVDALLDEKLSYADNGILGAKNLLQVPYHHSTGVEFPVGSSVTNAGITYTHNADHSITVNGTATGGSYCIFNRKQDWSEFDLYGKEVTLSVSPVLNSVFLQLYDTDNSRTLYRTDSSTGEVTFTFPTELKNNTSWNISINILNGTTINDVTYYPMLRLASDTDSTYQPYAMTNKELTESNRKLTEFKTYVTPNIGARFYKIGRVCYVSFESAVSDKAYVDEDIMDTIPEEFRPIYSASFLDALGTSHNRIIIYDTIRAKGSFAAGQNIRGCLTYITNN